MNALRFLLFMPSLGGGISAVFSPVDLSGLFAWFDASDIDTVYQDTGKTLVSSSTDPIGAWEDKSGNGNDLLQSTEALKLTYRTNQVNGLPAVRSDNDTMQTVTFPEQSQPNTVYLVVRGDSNLQNYSLFDGVSSSKRCYLRWGAGEAQINAGSATVTTSTGQTLDITSPTILTYIVNGAGTKFYQDGVEHLLSANPGTHGLTGITLGATFTSTQVNYRGLFCEIIAKNGESNTAEVQDVIDYLANKWGIVLPSQISITSPAMHRTYQRNGSNQASIAISGTYRDIPVAPTAIEARFNGGSWVTIDASPSGGNFSGTLSDQTAGQGDLEVRFSNDTSVVASVQHIGIGDIFVVAGQSNASGRGENNQVYSHATIEAALFGNDYAWKELVDPSDSNVNQDDNVSSDSNAAGSPWPLIATSFLADQGVPIAFVPCAKGGTSINDWQKGTDNDRSTLYGSMQYRVGQVGGCKAVLWHQGERDVSIGTAEATYNLDLDDLANDINTDLGCKMIVANIHDITGDEAAVNNAITTAISDNSNVLQGPDNSGITTSPDSLHFTTDAELLALASRWWSALQTAFYS